MKEILFRDILKIISDDSPPLRMDLFLSDKAESLHQIPHPVRPELEDFQGESPDKADGHTVLQVERLVGTIGEPGVEVCLDAGETGKESSPRPAGGYTDPPPAGKGFRNDFRGGNPEFSGRPTGSDLGDTVHSPGKADHTGLGCHDPGKGPPDDIGSEPGRFQVFCEEDRPPGEGGEKEGKKRRIDSVHGGVFLQIYAFFVKNTRIFLDTQENFNNFAKNLQQKRQRAHGFSRGMNDAVSAKQNGVSGLRHTSQWSLRKHARLIPRPSICNPHEGQSSLATSFPSGPNTTP